MDASRMAITRPSRSWSRRSIRPSRRDSPSRCPSRCGSVWVSTSLRGGTRISRRKPLAIPFITASTGRATRAKARNGSARISAERSGCEIAHDLGAISPTTMCRNVTTASATASATACEALSGRPSACSGSASTFSNAGSETTPRPSVHMVMPSWAPASISDSSEIPATAARAGRLPARAARSSRGRRAATRANSAATKKPLPASSSTVTTRAVSGSISPHPPRRPAPAAAPCAAPAGPRPAPRSPPRRRRRAARPAPR